MTLYIIRDDTVTAYASAPARVSEDQLRVRSAKEIETSGLLFPGRPPDLSCPGHHPRDP